MDCTRIEQTITDWLEGSATQGADLEACAAHIAACPACRARHGRLLPLLSREASGASGAPLPDAILVDAVMDRIGSSRPAMSKPTVAVFARVLLPLAAAAALALALILPRIGPTGPVLVTFRLYAPDAASVGIAADFNGWSPSGYELSRSGAAGQWEITVPLERGKMYLYNFVLDGQTWIADPGAELIMDDGFGSKSSALSI